MGLLDKLRETTLAAEDLEKYRDEITQIQGNISPDGSFIPRTNTSIPLSKINQSFLSRFSFDKRESYIDSLYPIPVIDQGSLTINGIGIARTTETTTDQLYSTQDYMEEDYV